MNYFKDKVAIVTGAGSGIGRELALQLAKSGALLAITDMRQERIDKLLAELKDLGANARGYLVDHSDLAQVKGFRSRFLEDWPRVDLMCVNSGVGMGANVEQCSIKDWQWVINNNLWSVIYMINQFLPGMISSQGGQVLITASGAGLIGIPGTAVYCASKFALVGLGETLRAELGKYNIKVSVLCPGIINTNIVRDSRIYLQDQAGGNVKSKVDEFYVKFGALPGTVARDALRGLKKNRGIQLSPLNMWLPWLVKRVSPALYQGIVGLVWRKGWLV